jgi:hypothetical protein
LHGSAGWRVISIPTSTSQAWTAAEFTRILARIGAIGYRQPLDLQINYDSKAPEWNTYGFAPAVWSAGGDLIDHNGYRRVDGFMNGGPAIGALAVIQGWATARYVNPDRDRMAFGEGKTPISWVGHWLFDAYTKAFPGDVETTSTVVSADTGKSWDSATASLESRETIWNAAGIVGPPSLFATTRDGCRSRTKGCPRALFEGDALMPAHGGRARAVS